MTKNLTINPNKMSQPAGAALALMGVKDMIPLWHGVQGCTAFAKVLFISHFREPMPFQNTAISQANVIMGSDENILKALEQINNQAEIIGLITTGVSETSGVDLTSVIKNYKNAHPGSKVVNLNTPDFEGNLASGYANATKTLLDSLVESRSKVDPKQIAVLPGPYITPGEVERLRSIIRDFGLNPLFCPDLGDSLYGYLKEKKFSPASSGGISVSEISKLSNSCMVLSVGSTMEKVAAEFAAEHCIPTLHYNSLGILEEIDHFFKTLEWLSNVSTGNKYLKMRQHYLDTLLDTDFCFHGRRVAVAGDVEFVKRWKAPLSLLEVETLGMGNVPEQDLDQGNYADFADKIMEQNVDIVIGNSHVARLAEEIGKPVIRSGIPVTDRFGEPQSIRIGYEGASRLLMECANAFLEIPQHPEPYQSELTATLV
ncbi:MAG: nitrogenase iron-molybdenum cofactor biosynthesis protein NifN [Proteobacteria bacterium]|nr:nitrogenase iron-molybdenum cofactor biosynthesis protein NifN [Pseudomonadota bacterium]